MTRALAPGRILLCDGWELTRTLAGACASPADLASCRDWMAVAVPGTVAAAIQPGDFTDKELDAADWWYRVRFDLPSLPRRQAFLVFEGLATLATVWLNGTVVAETCNMFRTHRVEVTGELREENELVIRFASLTAALASRRPRPRWQSLLVGNQRLRSVRTSLHGRIPSWSPPLPPVGPWRPIALELDPALVVRSLRLRPAITDGQAMLHLDASLLVDAPVAAATLRIAAALHDVTVTPDGAATRLTLDRAVAGVQPWWPHTHGDQPLYEPVLTLEAGSGDGGSRVDFDLPLPRVGFRDVRCDREGNRFTFSVNGREIFARGACWLPPDSHRLTATAEEYRRVLKLVRDGGFNMLRITGVGVYEDDLFFDCCDEFGILVWQDFMFANLDYPANDEAFLCEAELEVEHVLSHLQGRPSLALLCGNSEMSQQAHMLGLPPSMAASPLFDRVLPELAATWLPDVPYWPSSPAGGALSFRTDEGDAHYYGIGAYRRALSDVRTTPVLFASECLGFANVPEPDAMTFLPAHGVSVHEPAWKARSPRDAGAGIDFDDIRDHYVEVLFGVDAVEVRAEDPERYLALSRRTTGELMDRVFAEWRRSRSPCSGGLVWHLKDQWPGAGWGILDACGQPKAAYHYLARRFRPLNVALHDEGLNGLRATITNERPTRFVGSVVAELHTFEGGALRTATADVAVDAWAAVEVDVDAMFDGFVDLTYAYRFGPPAFDVVVVVLVGVGDGAPMEHACFFPQRVPSRRDPDVRLKVSSRVFSPGRFALSIEASRFAYGVSVEVPGFAVDDSYFHLPATSVRDVVVTAREPCAPLRGSVDALNAGAPAPIPAA